MARTCSKVTHNVLKIVSWYVKAGAIISGEYLQEFLHYRSVFFTMICSYFPDAIKFIRGIKTSRDNCMKWLRENIFEYDPKYRFPSRLSVSYEDFIKELEIEDPTIFTNDPNVTTGDDDPASEEDPGDGLSLLIE